MRIDITVTMGEDSTIMSVDEAKGLYLELGKIFGNSTVGSGKRNREPETVAKSRDTGPNPKVEAARQRAAARTSGCGASRDTGSGCRK